MLRSNLRRKFTKGRPGEGSAAHRIVCVWGARYVPVCARWEEERSSGRGFVYAPEARLAGLAAGGEREDAPRQAEWKPSLRGLYPIEFPSRGVNPCLAERMPSLCESMLSSVLVFQKEI